MDGVGVSVDRPPVAEELRGVRGWQVSEERGILPRRDAELDRKLEKSPVGVGWTVAAHHSIHQGPKVTPKGRDCFRARRSSTSQHQYAHYDMLIQVSGGGGGAQGYNYRFCPLSGGTLTARPNGFELS